jgi:hypothetical protein
MSTSLENKVLAYFGELVVSQVRDVAIRQWERLATSDQARLEAPLRDLLERGGTNGEAILRYVIPAIVDTAIHQFLFLLEQGDVYGITVAVQTPSGERASNLAESSDGLSGDYVDWSPTFSKVAEKTR